jgi:predicted transcriptional regulator
MPDDLYFPPRELEVMGILWRLGSATVSEVRDQLESDLAYTSVLSALQSLEEKGHVRHEEEGRAYRYFAVVEANEAGRGALARIRESVFQGSAEKMLAHFVSDESLSRADLERLRNLLTARLKEAP